MRRIMIIGSPGAGKFTLAKEIGRRTEIEVCHLDTHFWQPGWKARPQDEFDRMLRDTLSSDSWIIDGNYNRTLELRAEHADTIIFLDRPLHLCLWRIVKRRFQYAGSNRDDMAEGCNEKLDLEFIKFVLKFPKDGRKAAYRLLKDLEHKRETVVLRSNSGIRQFLEML